MKTGLRGIVARGALAAIVSSQLFVLAPAATAETQSAYRWRNDDGSESAATYAQAENTSDTIPQSAPERLRMGVANNGSESELLEQANKTFAPAEGNLVSAAVDSSGGYAYFGTGTSPGSVIKVRLSDFTKVATLTLDTGENDLNAMFVYPAQGYLYVGAHTSPGRIIKISLSSFTKVSAITMSGGGANFNWGLLDATAGNAYFGGFTNLSSPAKVTKISLGSFTETATLTAASGENATITGVIDASGGYLYFSTATLPGKIVKVDLASFTETAVLSLASGENSPNSSVIDVSGGYAYFGTFTSPGKVVKIKLSDFTQEATLTLSSGTNSLTSAVIDAANGYAYFGSSPGKIAKIKLSDFTEDATLSTSQSSLQAAAIDLTGGYAYFVTYSQPGHVLKIRLSDFTENASLDLPNAENQVDSAVIDVAGGYAYFGTNTSPGKIIKIRLSDFAKIDTLTLNAGENRLHSAVIDTTGGYAYFGTDTSPAIIVKVRLSDFTRIGSVTLDSDRARSAVIDTANGFAYFGMYGNSGVGRAAKVDVDPGHSFAQVGASISFTSGRNNPRSAVIDTVNHFAYFGTLGTGCSGCGTPGTDTYVVKVDVNPSNTFQQTASLGVEAQGVEDLRTAVIDVAGGYAYFGDKSGNIAKIDVAALTYDSKITNSDAAYLSSSVIDTANGYAYFGSNTSPGKVYKIDLGAFAEDDKITLGSGENALFAATLDGTHGYVYFGTSTNPGKVAKISIAPKAQFRLEYGLKTSTCAAISTWVQVPATATSEDWEMAASSNITDGATTTDSAGLTNGNTSFQSGEIHDATSQTASISLGEQQFTELEFSVQPTTNATVGNDYCFRLTDAGSVTGFTYTQYALATIGAGGSNDPTLSNAVTMSRLKVSTSSTVSISFDLQNELTGTWTATFPVGFSVTGAMTSGTCSGGGTVDTFAFNGGSRTMTAEKHACSGTLTLSGGTVTTPSSPGLYFITWTNDDPGEGGVAIVDDDQVTVTAQVTASITFDIDTAVTDTESAAPYAVPLGTITTTDTRVSGATDGINSIWLDLDTNASAGAVITVKNANGASGLVSTSVPGDTIDSANGTMADGTENYGICSISEADTGGNLDDLAPYDGTCAADSETNVVGGLSTTPTDIYDTDGAAISGGRARIGVNAAISGTTVSHNDYTDTLTFIATGTF